MKGHIRERSPSHWGIVIDIKDAAGRRKRKWHSFAGTKRQAQDECTRLLRELQTGSYVEPQHGNLGRFSRSLARVRQTKRVAAHLRRI